MTDLHEDLLHEDEVVEQVSREAVFEGAHLGHGVQVVPLPEHQPLREALVRRQRVGRVRPVVGVDVDGREVDTRGGRQRARRAHLSSRVSSVWARQRQF